ncbi:MAG: hypothetical protein ACYTX0_63650, partial [Nostoc sp.]
MASDLTITPFPAYRSLWFNYLKIAVNFGNPFFPGLPFLQLSKNRAIADHALSALACLAIEFSL